MKLLTKWTVTFKGICPEGPVLGPNSHSCLPDVKVQMSHLTLHLSWTLSLYTKNITKLIFSHMCVATCYFSSCSQILKCSNYVPVHKAQINKPAYHGYCVQLSHPFYTWYSPLHMYDLGLGIEKDLKHLSHRASYAQSSKIIMPCRKELFVNSACFGWEALHQSLVD